MENEKAMEIELFGRKYEIEFTTDVWYFIEEKYNCGIGQAIGTHLGLRLATDIVYKALRDQDVTVDYKAVRDEMAAFSSKHGFERMATFISDLVTRSGALGEKKGKNGQTS